MIKIHLSNVSSLSKLPECLVLPLHHKGSLGPLAQELDILLKGQIQHTLQRKLYTPEPTTVFHITPSEGAVKLVVIIATESEAKTSDDTFCRWVKQALTAVKYFDIKSVGVLLEDYNLPSRDMHWKVSKGSEAALNATYGYYAFKKKSAAAFNMKTIHLIVNQPELYTSDLARGEAVSQGMSLMRDMGHTPPNICNPDYMVAAAQDVAKLSKKFSCTILEDAEIKALKMGGIVAVAQGSRERPRFIVLEYKAGPATQQPIVLIGKGVCFDTGGLSLKAPTAMVSMKFDMCGGASLLGAAKAIALLALPINVVFLIPCVTNMPDKDAYRPDDVITTMAGLHIEITNTDAEGRMILCDALTYAKRYNPQYVVDVATLTGAVIMALGHHRSGLFANNDTLANLLFQAAENSVDPTWRFPMDPAYAEPLKSTIADMVNSGEAPGARSITAACFLARFAEEFKWAHLDIAGIGMPEKKSDYITGRPVPMLVEFLVQQAKNKSEKTKKT
jgi:leucyl aminopeptidase